MIATLGLIRTVKDKLTRLDPAGLTSDARRAMFLLVVGIALSVFALTARPFSSPDRDVPVGLLAGVLVALLLSLFFVARLLRQLNLAQRREREIGVARSQFLARMSQELRVTLNAARDGVPFVRDGRPLSPNEQALLNVVNDVSAISLRYLDNVADLANVETDAITITPAEFDLHSLLNGVTAMIRRSVDPKRVAIMTRIAPDVPFRLTGDSHHLRVVLANLLSIAVMHLDRGRVWLEVTKTPASAPSATLRFELIESAGVAVEAARTSGRWNEFIVAMARRLVDRMGGRTDMGGIHGSTAPLWFELSFAALGGDDVAPSAVDGRAVLLSQDASLTASFAERLPCQLLTSSSIVELIEMLLQTSRLGNAPHVVFVDERAVAGADSACTELCEKALWLNIPVVLITDETPTAHRLRELGLTASLPCAPAADQLYAVLHASPSWMVAASEPKVATIAPSLWSGREQPSRPRILVADDIQTNLLVTSRMLEAAGYEVDAVDSGGEALRRLLAGGYRLAVLDMHMPGFDGPDVLRQYRALRPRSPVPIIMLTANVSLDAQQTSAEAGADAYLAKPVTSIQLLGEVKRLLNMHKVEIVPFGAKPTSARTVEADAVLDVTVLAELDRLSRDPRELKTWISQYEQEGHNLLEKIAAAGQARDHQTYCDAVHALKSTAANVGARKLMAACQRVGALAFAEFLRDRDIAVHALHRDFDDSLTALRQLGGVQGGRESGS